MKKKLKLIRFKKLIPIVALFIILALVLHVFYVPKTPHFTLTYMLDSVRIEDDGVYLYNIPIKHNGLPGVMVHYEGFLVRAFINAESYYQAKRATPTTEVFDNGVSISCSLTFVTAGDYSIQPYQVAGSREHTHDNEYKSFDIYKNNNPLYRKLRYNIVF